MAYANSPSPKATKTARQKPTKNILIFFKKPIDKQNPLVYNNQARKQWLVGQAVKTLASHAENMGSIPVRVTKENRTPIGVLFSFFWCLVRGISPSDAVAGIATLLRRFRVGSLAGRGKFPGESRQDTNRCPVFLSFGASCVIEHSTNTPCVARAMGSHLPLGDRQACLPGGK